MSTLNVNNKHNCYSTTEYKHGICQDPVCGQSRIGIRGTTKNEGKSDSRRTETTRVKSMDGLCKFKISLRLLPVKHWRITNCHKCKGFHNHIQLEKRELSVGSNVLSSIEKRICVSAGKYGGIGTAHNMLFDFNNYTLTLEQTKYIRKSAEDDGTTPGTCDTQQLIDYLSHSDEFCYTALYYEVDDTTVFAVKVAKEKQRNKAQIRRQH